MVRRMRRAIPPNSLVFSMMTTSKPWRATMSAALRPPPTADHERPLADRKVPLYERLQPVGAGHRHAHQVLRLGRGLHRVGLVHPRVLIPDVGHLKEVLVEAAGLSVSWNRGSWVWGEQAATTTLFTPFPDKLLRFS